MQPRRGGCTRRGCTHCLVIAAALAMALSAAEVHAQKSGAESPRNIIEQVASASPALAASSSDPRIVRSRMVRLVSPQIGPGFFHGARLQLFDDMAVDLAVEAVETQSPETFNITGTIAGDPHSRFVIAACDGAVVANIWKGDGAAYQLRPLASDDVYLVQELAMDRFARCANGRDQLIARKALPRAPDQPSPPPSPQCPDTIDVLIVYTERARLLLGSVSAIRALCQASIASTNLSYSASGIVNRVRLVHAQEVNYQESDLFSTDLARLRVPGDGFLDDVQQLRDQYAADAVSMIVGSSNSCGIAYVMGFPDPSFEALAYSVVSAGCAVSNLTFAHELGHNQGCQHNHGDGSMGAFPYAFGHRFTGASGTAWRDIMSSAPGLRVPRFSNPGIFYDSVPTGVPENEPDAANCALCINNTAGLVTAFRDALAVDCNNNGIADWCDISAGTSLDANENGLPDECDAPPCTARSSTMLTAAMPRSLDDMGVSVAITRAGDRIVVGSDLADDAGMNSGAADVFARVGQQWAHEARLIGSDSFLFQQFGRSVAFSPDGQWLIIGAPRDGLFVSDIGAGYVFRFDGSQWVQHAKLNAADFVQGDLVGFSVALAADASRAVLGSIGNDHAGPQSGAAYLFRREGSQWVEEAKIIADDAAPNCDFGCSVAISDAGDRVLIGARGDDGLALNAGAAYIFGRNGTMWSQRAKVVTLDPAVGDRFGASVSLSGGDGSTAVIGAPRDDGPGVDAGAAYVFHYNGSMWLQEQKLVASDAAAYRLLGTSVALSADGNLALAGSPLALTTFAPNEFGVAAGAAYHFGFNGSAWVQQQKFFASDGAANDNLGISVALGGDMVRGASAVAGAVFDDHHGEVHAGSVRVFTLPSQAQADCNGNGLPDPCDIANGLSLDANANGVPDECDPGACPADIANGDGLVSVDDLMAVLGLWGPCPPPCAAATCIADINHDCAIDIDDLLRVILGWGRCPAGTD